MRENHPQHPFNILQNLAVPETEHTKTFVRYPSRATFIVKDGVGMLAAIQFNDQPSDDTYKIYNEWPKPHLPSEFVACELAISQVFPQQFFGGSCFAAHTTNAVDGFLARWLPHLPSPSHAAEERRGPLPLPEAGEEFKTPKYPAHPRPSCR